MIERETKNKMLIYFAVNIMLSVLLLFIKRYCLGLDDSNYLIYLGALLNTPGLLMIMMIKGPGYMLHFADPNNLTIINFIFYILFIALMQWFYMKWRKRRIKSS